jgi:V/A-type H+-transporting ATPase subunit A
VSTPRIRRITGTLVEVSSAGSAGLYELVRVGELGLLGEVIRLSHDTATVQVYEETAGLRIGEPVTLTGASLSITLGPGLLGSVLDGLGRPLRSVAELSGDFIAPGIECPTLDPSRSWNFVPRLLPGTVVASGDVLGEVEERPGLIHRVLVPPGMQGTLGELRSGPVTVSETLGKLEDGTPLHLTHSWPVRTPRPVGERLPDQRPMITGQRIFDLLYPVAEGGTVAVPGGFGTGKTVIEQSLARYAEADIVVYIGCGERGNEMSEVLHEFPQLTDPQTGRSIMDRTVMVVNTSNMPVAAREASIYLGVTIAEYYRDMGFRVALMADSLSRWAEALREISARLEEMPGEEGYPTYLANRLGQFYERAGYVRAAGVPQRAGALTLISAISPPGGDLSEPVTQASLRVTGALWALDPALAHQRQFPAVDWETSYSHYVAATAAWFAENGGADWAELRQALLSLLQRGQELREIAALVGPEALQDSDRLLLDLARLAREVVLGQSAFDPNDASSPIPKTYQLIRLLVGLHQKAGALLESGAPVVGLDLEPTRQALFALRDTGPKQLAPQVSAVETALAALGTGASTS